MDRDYQQVRRISLLEEGTFIHTTNHIAPGQQLITVLLTSDCDFSCFSRSPSITIVSLEVTKWFSWAYYVYGQNQATRLLRHLL